MELSDSPANLYLYVRDNPIIYLDPRGLAGIPETVPPNVPGGPYTAAGPGQKEGTFYGPQQSRGPRTICRWVPPDTEGGPPGSKDIGKFKYLASPGNGILTLAVTL